MLTQSIEDESCNFFEHRWLHSIKGDVPKDFYKIPLGKPKILKTGKDITIFHFFYDD